LDSKNSRFKDLLKALRLKQADFAKKTGITPTAVNHYYAGARDVSTRSAKQIAEAFPNVNIEWLLFGEGEMFVPETQSKNSIYETNPPLTTVNEDQVKYLKEALDRMEADRDRWAKNCVRWKRSLSRTKSTRLPTRNGGRRLRGR